MPTSPVLDDLIDALEGQSDTLFPFLDRETGEVFLIQDESLSQRSGARDDCFASRLAKGGSETSGPYRDHRPLSRAPQTGST
jgi:hypothetical protein